MNVVDVSHPLGQKINVIGGGGKTTLAKALSAKYSYKNIELDYLHFLPNWVEREPEDFRKTLAMALKDSGDKWVVDGNYKAKLQDYISSRADMIIWLDLPWFLIFRRILLRSFKRLIDRTQVCGDNTETWRLFFSRNALWWWYIVNRKEISAREAEFSEYIPQNTPVIRIKNAKELNAFYLYWLSK